jgi:hypothetical protein
LLELGITNSGGPGVAAVSTMPLGGTQTYVAPKDPNYSTSIPTTSIPSGSTEQRCNEQAGASFSMSGLGLNCRGKNEYGLGDFDIVARLRGGAPQRATQCTAQGTALAGSARQG